MAHSFFYVTNKIKYMPLTTQSIETVRLNAERFGNASDMQYRSRKEIVEILNSISNKNLDWLQHHLYEFISIIGSEIEARK